MVSFAGNHIWTGFYFFVGPSKGGVMLSHGSSVVVGGGFGTLFTTGLKPFEKSSWALCCMRL